MSASSSGAGERRLPRWGSWLPWLFGVALGLVVMGPALAPGVLLNLDLVVTEVAPVPRGVWGLGPELPRRVPFYLPAAWLSPVVPATITVKAMMVAIVAVAYVGGHRRLAFAGPLAGVGAGLLVALSPMLLTRLAIGHLMISATMALLLWAYPVLLRPGADVARTALWCAAFAVIGNYGGLVALFVVVAGLAVSRPRRWVAVLGVWAATQLVWLVPGVIVSAQGAGRLDATVFVTGADGLGGHLRLLVGHGFWQEHFQVGADIPWQAAAAALVLVPLAAIGHRDLPDGWRRGAGWLAGIGLAVALASTTPWVEQLWVPVSQNAVGSNLRESQRLLPLFLVWLAAGSVLGARRVAGWTRRNLRETFGGTLATVVGVSPIAMALVLGAPGLWGLGGQLCAIDLGDEWYEARAVVDADPGTVLVLPFAAYVPLRFCDQQLQVLNPWPLFLGGDVLVSSDLGLSLERAPTPERADPREPYVRAQAVELLATGGRPTEAFAEVGPRWIVLMRAANYLPFERLLDADPGLERVTAGKDASTYRVLDWPGDAVAAGGGATSIDPVLEPFARIEGEVAVTWARPGATGWLRGGSAASTTDAGLLAVPGGTGPVWYWPTFLVLAGDAAALAVVAWALRRVRLDRRPER